MESKVKDIISNILHIPKENLERDLNINDLVKDSIELFELLVAFEQEFSHTVKYEEIVNIETIGDIIDYIEKISTEKTGVKK